MENPNHFQLVIKFFETLEEDDQIHLKLVLKRPTRVAIEFWLNLIDSLCIEFVKVKKEIYMVTFKQEFLMIFNFTSYWPTIDDDVISFKFKN